jgi:arylsulfatase A-like enzyme
LYIDCDSLRPDHLGCYGYHRNTSPNIDRIAAQGLRCTNYYASDAPCLPSRAALMSGRFGIHTGVVNHGGVCADMRPEGAQRGFHASPNRMPFPSRLVEAGLRTALVGSFPYRHGAWWFYEGFMDIFNNNIGGLERAEVITPPALEWIDRRGREENWYLHVNYWDPHTPYDTPVPPGIRFVDDPPAAWYTEALRRKQWDSYGPHSARETCGYTNEANDYTSRFPDSPREIASLDDYKRWIDGYDNGIRYMDDHIGLILNKLDELGVLEETAVIVSADHGENHGELNVFGDHQTADYITARVPLVVRWPGVTTAGSVYEGLQYHLDLGATLVDLVGGEASPAWDGESFASALRGDDRDGRPHVVVSQCAWSCQRAVRWGQWMLIRTYHDGLKDFPDVMLFDIEEDPHELTDLAGTRRDIVNEGLALIVGWTADMMRGSEHAEDPLWRVIREGGPFHTRDCLDMYCARLRASGRAHHAASLLRRHS